MSKQNFLTLDHVTDMWSLQGQQPSNIIYCVVDYI